MTMYIRNPSKARATMPRRRVRRPWVAVPLAIAGAALVAACGGPSYAGGSAASSSVPAPEATGAVVASAATGLGTILVDGKGRTVYDFANDTGTTSTCNGGCAENWHPVAAPDTLPSSVPDVTGALGSTTRDDGSEQLTVAGHPVYTFEGDKAPGQTNGNGITLDGGLWTVVSPDGASVTGDGGSSSAAY
jgi:predicted lipoprotein with Yx(FWY)xxD motif